uniref:G-protein coupled receptors family 1 profile domain-containing protein n=1 Tax=Panagrolaimus sp. JU765 TaxID=591449 RepID=A0AC34RLM6_9BILA
MTFFKEVENVSEIAVDGVPALESYLPNSIIYVILYILALPPNLLLAYMGLKPGLITSRVKYPTLGMSLANLFGLVGFLILNLVYLFAVYNDTRLTLFTASFLRTILYNSTYVCYFLFPLLAADQWLFICQNYQLQIKSLCTIIGICFAIPMVVAVYDLFFQDVVLYDFMFLYIRMSPYTNLQQHKAIVYTYIFQAFLPLVLATPYYIANLCFIFHVEIDVKWFIVGEAIIGAHPLTNALTTFFLRPYRKAFKQISPFSKASLARKYDSIQDETPTLHVTSAVVDL